MACVALEPADSLSRAPFVALAQEHFDPTLFYQPGPQVPKHYWSPGEDELLAAGGCPVPLSLQLGLLARFGW